MKKPIQLKLEDLQYPFQGFSHTRPNARALLQNDQGLFAFNHILADDKFGHRDYPETLGGGIDLHETPPQAVIREVEEESGLLAKVMFPIGVIEDAYHLIQRKNINHYFYLRVIGNGHQHRTLQEKTLIHDLKWLTLEEALMWYRRLPDEGIAQLIKQREVPVIEWMIDWIKSQKMK
ncbi:MAG: NUDIX domain-containing protein [Bacilli bacterium]